MANNIIHKKKYLDYELTRKNKSDSDKASRYNYQFTGNRRQGTILNHTTEKHQQNSGWEKLCKIDSPSVFDVITEKT